MHVAGGECRAGRLRSSSTMSVAMRMWCVRRGNPGPEELYDVEADPGQTRDLLAPPEPARAFLLEARERLTEIRETTPQAQTR